MAENDRMSTLPSWKLWQRECQHWRGKVLTGSRAHYCPDWDYLPIDETTPEMECCTCAAFR